MIVAIKGKLHKSTPLMAVLETSGIFYEVNIPLTTAERLPKNGSDVMLHTLAVYREDSQSLFGFYTESDRDFFKTLVEKVSGIGPKIALAMMSRMSVATLSDAIACGDVALLSKCPGIGRKTAERLVLELKGTLIGGVAGAIENLAASDIDTRAADAIAALTTLGFKVADADKAVRQILPKLGADFNTEDIVKHALSKQA